MNLKFNEGKEPDILRVGEAIWREMFRESGRDGRQTESVE